MTITETFLALSVSTDIFVVALALGIKNPMLSWKKVVGITCIFVLLQTSFAFLGWQISQSFYLFIAQAGHWISFTLLTLVGLGMVKNALEHKGEGTPKKKLSILYQALFIGIAASIDAFAVGFTLESVSERPFMTIAYIGVITSLMSFAALIGTHKIPLSFARSSELGAGIVLIIIGSKIVLQQLFGV